MCFRGRENTVALTRGEDRLSDSVGGLSCLSCVRTKLHVYSHECPKSSCFDENLVHYLHIRAFGPYHRKYCHNDGHDMLSCDFSVQTCG
jgi:hypothetical protein